MSRETVDINIYSGRGDLECGRNLEVVLRWLAGKLWEIPPEFRNKATFEVQGDSEYGDSYIEINYSRPETDEEMNNRLVKKELRTLSLEKREIEQFVALRAKYPNV